VEPPWIKGGPWYNQLWEEFREKMSQVKGRGWDRADFSEEEWEEDQGSHRQFCWMFIRCFLADWASERPSLAVGLWWCWKAHTAAWDPCPVSQHGRKNLPTRPW
jgi:hypothetical protein